MRLSSIHVYPVKGLRGHDLETAAVQPWGLAGDRRYMLVRPDGQFITQREFPALTQAVADYHPDGVLRVRSTEGMGLPELTVPAPDEAEQLPVRVWRSSLSAALGPDAAHAWFSKLVGTDVRLVYLDDPTRRPVTPQHGRSTDRVSFADGYPLLVVNRASLDRLNEWLLAADEVPEALPMNRFRPSIVVDGADAWAEDDWPRLRIGDVGFRVAKPCDRCVVTTIDQDTGRPGRGPLRMLAKRHRIGKALAFGQYLIPDGVGPIKVGDEVRVLG